MESQTTDRARSGYFAFALIAAGAVLGLLGPATTPAAAQDFTASVSPRNVAAGSSVSALSFRFSATTNTSRQVSVLIPAVAKGTPWSAPQVSNPTAPGYVAVVKQTCASAGINSITGSPGGPWTIVATAACAGGTTFSINYGAGSASRVSAPTRSGSYTFTTKVEANGGGFVSLASQPSVTVAPTRATTLRVRGLANATAGSAQSAIVTLRDAYGNFATGYRGQVHFSSTDANAVLPANYTFTASDAGVHTFTNEVTLKTAGSRSVRATDTGTGSLTGAATITISPGSTKRLDVTFSSIPGTAIPGQTVRVGIDITAVDAYGNLATGDNSFINVRVHKEGSDQCSGCEDLLGAYLQNGTQRFDIPVAVVSAELGVSAFPVPPEGVDGSGSIFKFFSAPPDLDQVKLDWDPNSTQNPDGTYDGQLLIKDPNTSVVQQTDPNSVVVSGDPIVNGDGTTYIPIVIDLVGGGTFSTTITVSTATNPETGEFTTANYGPGTELQILGCDSANETFASIDAGTAPTDLPPPPPCPSQNFSATTISANTAYVSNPLDHTYLSPILGTYVAP
jgi:hypothetical protein